MLCRNRMLTYVSRECNVYGYLTWLNDETVNSNFHRNKTVNDNVPFVNGLGKSFYKYKYHLVNIYNIRTVFH